MAEKLTSQQLDDDRKYIIAIVEQLTDSEGALARVVKTYAGRKRAPEMATAQQLTKALAAVQAGRNRLAKALEEMSEIEPMLWDAKSDAAEKTA